MMKKKDNIEALFDRLKIDFDVKEPSPRHQQRFLEKLNKEKQGQILSAPKKYAHLKPLIGIAACIAVIATIFIAVPNNAAATELAGVSPEMAKTQHFYTTAIATKLRNIEKFKDPKIAPLVQDAMAQLQKLEAEYARLQIDLAKSGNDSRVIFAMIANFQNRIKVLQNLMKQIEQLKQDKNENLI